MNAPKLCPALPVNRIDTAPSGKPRGCSHGNRVGHLRADRSVLGAHCHVDDDRLASGEGVTSQLDHGIVQRRGLRTQGDVLRRV